MNDEELIRLIQERVASEWTPAEIAALRRRLPLSPELRQVLADRLELDGQLIAGLGDIDITVEKIFQRAQRTKTLARRKMAAGILGSLGLMLLLIGVGIWYTTFRPAVLDDDDQAIVEAEAHPNAGDAGTSVAQVAEDPAADAVDALTAIPQIPMAEVVATKPLDPMPKPAPPAPEPEPVGPIEPWTAAYSAKAPIVRADSDVLRADFATAGHDDFPEEEARKWWIPTGGQAFNWGQDAVAGKRIARFQGVAQLRAPWRPDSLLRVTLLDSAAAEFFFWRGKQGVSLRYYTTREPHVWAAYRVERDDAQSTVARRTSLLTTDSGAFFRATPGTFELQIQGEQLVLARGGIPLMIVPCGGLPEQVVLEGQCRFRGLSIHRSEPLPLPEIPVHPLVYGGPDGLAKMVWQGTADSAPVLTDTLPDGRLKCTVDSRDKRGQLFASIPRPGLYEVIFRIDNADPGTGITLGDPNGKPLAHLAVFKEQKSEQRSFGVLLPDEVREVADHDVSQGPVPYFAPGQWVRVVAGLGTLQVWTSGDRLHWGPPVKNPVPNIPGPVGSIGLMGLPGPMARSITLGQLEVRELSGLTALADGALLERVPQFAPEELSDGTLWIHRALESHPAGSEPDRWLNTCALAALQRGPQKEFGLTLLRRMLESAHRPEENQAIALAALRDAMLLLDLWDERQALPFAEHLQAIGLRRLEQGDHRPSRAMRAAWLQLPLWTITPAKSAFDRLANRELTAAVSRSDWKAAASMALEAQFWNTPTLPGSALVESAQNLDKLATWVRAVAAEQQPGLVGADSALPLAWRHPLVQQFNKEGYNLRAEFDAALQGQAYDDACRLVTSISANEYEGLLPDLHDRQLFVSMPTAILTALRDHPEFATAMNRDHGQSGLLRVRQAIADGHIDVIKSATVQFLGTPAAAEAHWWLGDQQLAAGKFSEAEAHYRFALDSATIEQSAQINPRLRLAAAWSGKPPAKDGDKFPPEGLALNGYQLTAAEFDALLTEARGRAQGLGQTVAATTRPLAPVAPVGYKLELKGQFDGNPGNNPGRNEFRFGDPFGKQLTYAVDDKLVYLSNRFQVNAYDPQTGQVKWAQGVGSEQGEAYDFAFHSMKPLILHDFVFVRRLTRAGAELCCLKRSDGTVVWKQRPMTHVLTDPVIWQGELCALIGGKVEDDLLQVEFARFDQATGVVTSQKPLVRFKDVWNQAIPCRWNLTERWAACQIGNITACVSTEGDLRWLRRPTWLPAPVDDLAMDGRAPEPLLSGNRLLLAVPGSRSLDCVDLLTGRLAWRLPVPELRGLRGANAERVVADVGDGLLGVNPETGEVSWHQPMAGLLETFAMDEQTILCSRRGKSLTPQGKPNLVWLDAATGKELAQTQLDAADKEEWQLGPVVPVGNKWWLLGGTGWKDHKRELLELVPVTATAPAPFVDAGLKSWAPDLTDAERSNFAAILPTWWPAADYKSRWQYVPGDVRGETRLMISRTGENQQPTFLTSRLQVPVEPSSLHFRVANQPGQKWRLVVRIENQVVLDQVLEDAATSSNWQEVVVDLTQFAGRSALATAMHGPVDGQPSEALWKRIELLKN